MRRISPSNEFALLSACCRWPPSGDRNEAVRIAAKERINWSRFTTVAKRHRVEGLVHDGLVRSGLRVPPDTLRYLQSAAAEIARQNLLFAVESARLHSMLIEAGVPVLFVKGVTLNRLAYDTLAIKMSWDIDILVPASATGDACAILRSSGYELLFKPPQSPEARPQEAEHLKESIWRHSGSRVVVEVHSRLTDNPTMLSGVSIATPPQTVEVTKGISLPTLPDAELFSYLCVHGATHAWSRLKWLADVGAMLAGREEEEVVALYRRSLELGAGRCSAQALMLCEAVLGLTLPQGLQEELRQDRAVRTLVDIGLGIMAGPAAEKELDTRVLGTLPIQISHFLFAPGWRHKAAELKFKLGSESANSGLPQGLLFLLPLVAFGSWIKRRMRLSARVRQDR